MKWTTYDYIASTIFYFTGSVGLCANILLIILIFTRSPKSLHVYRVFLLNVAFAEFIFTITSTAGQIRIIPNKWAFAYVPLGIARYFSPGVGYFIYSLELHAIFYTFLSFPLSFGYRYYVLIRPQPSVSTAIAICLCLWTVTFGQNVLFFFSESPSDEIRAYLAINKPNYSLEGWPISGNNMTSDPLTVVTLATIVLPMFPIYGLVMFFYNRAMRSMSIGLQMTDATLRGHKRLIRALTIQASLPLFFVFPPITIYLLYHLEFINATIIEYLVYVLFSFFPACSPIVTLYFVKPYNDAVRSIFCYCFCSGRIRKTASNIAMTNMGAQSTTDYGMTKVMQS